MKRFVCLLMTCCLLLGACGKTSTLDATHVSVEMTWQQQYDMGIHLLNEGKYEEAILVFRTMLEIDPKNVDVYKCLAEVYVAMGDFDMAVAVVHKGIDVTGALESLEEYLMKLETQMQGGSLSESERQETETGVLQEGIETEEWYLETSEEVLETEREETLEDKERSIVYAVDLLWVEREEAQQRLQSGGYRIEMGEEFDSIDGYDGQGDLVLFAAFEGYEECVRAWGAKDAQIALGISANMTVQEILDYAEGQGYEIEFSETDYNDHYETYQYIWIYNSEEMWVLHIVCVLGYMDWEQKEWREMDDFDFSVQTPYEIWVYPAQA